MIFGTGFDVDLVDRPEIARYTPHVDTWVNHVAPEEARKNPEAARFPYLGAGLELRSRTRHTRIPSRASTCSTGAAP